MKCQSLFSLEDNLQEMPMNIFRENMNLSSAAESAQRGVKVKKC